MWSNSNKDKSQNSSTALAKLGTGAKVGSVVGMTKMKQDVASCLSLNAADANTVVINEYSQKAGEYRGFNTKLQRASKAKLNTAREAMNTTRTVLNHANQAARQELAWQQQNAQWSQQMAGTMLDLQAVQHDQAGFTSYVSEANDLINW